MKKVVKVLGQVAWSGFWKVVLECGHDAKVKDRSVRSVDCRTCKIRK